MKSSDVWKSEVDDVEVEAVEAYLSRTKWRRYGKAGGVESWVRGRSGDSTTVSVLLPPGRWVDDYGMLVAQALRTVAAVENRSPEDLLRELREPESSLLTLAVELYGGERPDVPIRIAETTLHALVAMIESVTATLVRQEMAPQWQRQVMETYLRRVRLDDTEASAMSAVLPDTLGDETDSRVPEALGAELRHFQVLLEAGEVQQAWETGFGASAIRSLAPLADKDVFRASISVTPPTARRRAGPTTTVDLDYEALSSISVAAGTTADLQRDVAPAGPRATAPTARIARYKLVGPVVALERPDIRVEAQIGGRSIRVRLQRLSADHYQQAAHAHLENRNVRAIGPIVIRPKSATMTRVAELEIL